MTKTDPKSFKIADAADMAVTSLPSIDRHPGLFIRDTLMPEYGVTKLADLARRLGVNRSGLHRVLMGQNDVSRELAYRLGALMNDAVADLLIAWQQAWDMKKEAAHREALKEQIERLPTPAAD